MSKETKVVPEEFKGNPMFVIREFEDGEPSQYPVVSFGKKKAKAILEHIDELKQFVEENQ